MSELSCHDGFLSREEQKNHLDSTMHLSLFGWSPSSLIFKQNRGLYNDGSQYLYVNVGLGETIFPARIGARPEITLLTLAR